MDQDNEQLKVLVEFCTIIISATVAPYAALFELLIEKGILTNEEVAATLTPEKVEPIAKAMENKLRESIGKGAKYGT